MNSRGIGRGIAISIAFVMILAAVTMGGCATSKDMAKTFSDMSHEQRATMFMKIYTVKFESYQKMASRTDLSVEEVEYLIKKRDILEKMHTAISIYVIAIEVGKIPEAENEIEILNLIDEITRLVVNIN